MYQFFVDDAQVHKHEIVIEGSDVNHIRNVLRMKIDERIRISNMSGKAYFCHITLITEDMVVAEIDSEDDNGMGHFYGHPSVSEKIFCDFCKKYKVDNKMRDNVSRLIRFHEREIPLNKKSAHRFLISYGDENVKQLFTLKKADILGQNKIFRIVSYGRTCF